MDYRPSNWFACRTLFDAVGSGWGENPTVVPRRVLNLDPALGPLAGLLLTVVDVQAHPPLHLPVQVIVIDVAVVEVGIPQA